MRLGNAITTANTQLALDVWVTFGHHGDVPINNKKIKQVPVKYNARYLNSLLLHLCESASFYLNTFNLNVTYIDLY